MCKDGLLKCNQLTKLVRMTKIIYRDMYLGGRSKMSKLHSTKNNIQKGLIRPKLAAGTQVMRKNLNKYHRLVKG